MTMTMAVTVFVTVARHVIAAHHYVLNALARSAKALKHGGHTAYWRRERGQLE
jgi:hypothetical protein